MGCCVFLAAAVVGAAPCVGEPAQAGSFLYQPAYCKDDVPRCPAEPYEPQPGDIFLASDPELWSKLGHLAIGSMGVQHSAILFRRPDGHVAMLQAGPFNSLKIEVLDPTETMRKHVEEGDRVWIRRRRVPLTPEQSACLTAFAEKEEGKPFALWRMLAQITVFRTRGPLRTYFMGKVQGPDQASYYCSELVSEACVAAGLFNADDTRPSATYPNDLFFGRSYNLFIDQHLHMGDWIPPARWTPTPCCP